MNGTPRSCVTLKSSDNQEFCIDLDIALQSNTLRAFFDDEFPFRESETRKVSLPIHSRLLKRIIEFMEYKHNNVNNGILSEFKIADDETMELLDVASYLRI